MIWYTLVMLTSDQEKWLAHLPDDNHTEIFPYDDSCIRKFEKVKEQIRSVVGEETVVLHRGATSLGISGQGEIDIYVPTKPEKFDQLIVDIGSIFGKPESLYPLERARFVTYIDGIKAEVLVVNENGQNWLDSCRFENYLKENKEALEEYQKLKEDGRGLSTREYYRRKIEFINNILEKVKPDLKVN